MWYNNNPMSLTVKTNPFIIFCIVVCSLIGIYSAVNVYLKLTEVKVADSIGNSKTFDVPEQQQLLSTERTSVNVKGTNWSLNSFDSFNDQAQRDAEARAALNSQLYSSYQAAQSQERPSGLGGVVGNQLHHLHQAIITLLETVHGMLITGAMLWGIRFHQVLEMVEVGTIVLQVRAIQLTILLKLAMLLISRVTLQLLKQLAKMTQFIFQK